MVIIIGVVVSLLLCLDFCCRGGVWGLVEEVDCILWGKGCV